MLLVSRSKKKKKTMRAGSDYSFFIICSKSRNSMLAIHKTYKLQHTSARLVDARSRFCDYDVIYGVM